MNDNSIFIKKRGMTVGKAWILFLSMILIYVFLGIIVGIYLASTKSKIGSNIYEYILYLYPVTIGFLSLIGYYINLKELPRFKKVNLKIILLAIAAGICFRFASSIIEELPFTLINPDQLKDLAKVNYFVLTFPTILIILFQVGIIGHGLLRNYELSAALLSSSLVSIAHLELQTIISMVFFVALLLYMYFKTASFWLVIITTAAYTYIDLVFGLFMDVNLYELNKYRNSIIVDDNIYFVILVLSFLFLGLIVVRLTRLKSENWRRVDDIQEY